MPSLSIPPKPAPRLRPRGMGLRLRIGPNAFGNALGSSLAENMQPTTAAPQRTFADSIGKDPSWMQDWNAANAQSAPSPYADIERTLWEDTHGDNLIAGANAGGSPSGKVRLSAEEIELAAKYLNDTTAGNSSTSTPLTRKLASASGLSPSPFVDGTRITSGPVSAVGGFDRYGNSMNGAQFDLGQSWVGDLVKAPLNFATNTVELVGNNLNLSLTFPGDPSYIPFMQSMKLPYSTEAGSYAEFGLGILAGGSTMWARAPEVAASEIAGSRMAAGANSAAMESGAALPMGSRYGQMNQPNNPVYQPVRNQAGMVGDTNYSGHAFDRMQDRGIMPSVVNDTIINGVATPSRGGTTVYFSPTNNVSVVANGQGKVVTVTYGGK